MSFQHATIAEENRAAQASHAFVERGLERDLGPDAGGITERDCDYWH
jgi:hypothetical protein